MLFGLFNTQEYKVRIGIPNGENAFNVYFEDIDLSEMTEEEIAQVYVDFQKWIDTSIKAFNAIISRRSVYSYKELEGLQAEFPELLVVYSEL